MELSWYDVDVERPGRIFLVWIGELIGKVLARIERTKR